MEERSGDISNKMIIALVIITILVSFATTFAVLNKVDRIESPEQQQPSGPQGTSSGSIMVNIQKPPVTSGSIQMEILPRDNAEAS